MKYVHAITLHSACLRFIDACTCLFKGMIVKMYGYAVAVSYYMRCAQICTSLFFSMCGSLGSDMPSRFDSACGFSQMRM